MFKRNYKAIFICIVLALMALSPMAAAIEGSTGGIFGQKTILGLSADFWLLKVSVPLFLLAILFAVGLESKLIGTIAIAYIIGGVLEDFFWFVVNPSYGLGRWNSINAPWLSWFKVGSFEIPSFYLFRFVIVFVLWFTFFKNSSKVNHLLKKYFPKNISD